MEKPTVSIATVGDKKISSVTFKLMATSLGGTGWTAPGSTRVYIDISVGGSSKQSVEIPRDGNATVSFTNLVPSRNYTINASLAELGSDGYTLRKLDTDIGYFTSPAGDNPSETQFLSYAKQPEQFYSGEELSKTPAVRLYFKSTMDARDLFVRIIAPNNASKTYQIDSIYKYEDENEIVNTPFQNLQWNTTYAVKVFSINPGSTTESLVATLPSFTTPGQTYITGVTTKFSYKQKPQVSVVQKGSTKVSTVTFEVVADANEPSAQVVATLVGGSALVGGGIMNFSKDVAKKLTFENLNNNSTYAVSVVKQNSTGTNSTIAELGTFKTLDGTTVKEPAPADITQPAPAPAPNSPSIVEGVPRATSTGPTAKLGTTCTNGLDDDGDGRIDYYGGPNGEAPDPSCFKVDAEEIADDVAKGALVPCTDKCGFDDVFKLLNNVLKFVITVLLIPIFVIMIMYIGFKYLTSQGNPAMHLKFKKMLWHMFLGVVIILTAWLIVRTILTSLGYADGLLFFD
ncbi:hypothetical protein K2Q02_01385 [Patescibacteria group bacterium]|nr:hypothetical protein [Patescibacteria group bacterium]